jgi:histone deacetylase 11
VSLCMSSLKVAQVTELAPLAMLPHYLVDRKVLQPMRLHVGGSVVAAGLAVAHGWAVNLGGGMHHAHREDGAGWCPYADITLAVQRVRWVGDTKHLTEYGMLLVWRS